MNFYEGLKTEKPKKNHFSVIMSAVKKESGFSVWDQIDNYNYEVDKCNFEYAKQVILVSSGNEPKIYAYVETKEGKVIFSCRVLSDSLDSYAICARVAGAFMDIYNSYVYYNDLR